MIDTRHLMAQLPARRWFGGKGRALRSLELVDHAILDDGPPALVTAIVRVRYDDGAPDLYHLPLLVQPDGRTDDALDDVERLRLLGELMAHGVTIKGTTGSFHFGGPGLNPLDPPGGQSIRVVGAEQSNTSFVLDDSVIVKLFRRVQIGPNPDLELNRLLTNEGFENIPAQVGEVLYEGELEDEEAEIDLAIAQEFIKGGSEGWEHALNQLQRVYEEAPERQPSTAEVEERAGALLDALAQLGEATGSLHVTLGREEGEPDIAPEPVTAHDLSDWADAATRSLRRQLKSEIPEINALAGAIQKRIDALRTVSDAGLKLRVHGDYHLGQVMMGPRGWMLLDFEGEPLRSLEERRAKQSPLRDVAGMLRSFSYAAIAALFERPEPDSEEWKRLQPWADEWERLARERFLSAYLGRSYEGRFLPSDRDTVTVLLDVFEIDKALYEVGYEQAHRPEWIRIPLRGIERVVERGESG